MEGAQPSGSRISAGIVCSRDSKIGHGRAAVGFAGIRVVLEISEAEIGEPGCAHSLVKSSCQTVVVGDGAARQTEQAVSRALQWAQKSLPGKTVVGQAEAPEKVKRLAGAVIDTRIEAVLFKWPRSGPNEIVQNRSGSAGVGK